MEFPSKIVIAVVLEAKRWTTTRRERSTIFIGGAGKNPLGL